MNLSQLPGAVEALRELILSGQAYKLAIDDILEDYDVTEDAVRARFQQAFGFTPEVLAARHAKGLSIDTFITRFKQANLTRHRSHLLHTGKRFYMKSDVDTEKRWYRFLISHGHMVVIVDEISLSVGHVLDREFIDDIAWQIGWQRWSDWPVQGPQPSRVFV